MSFIKFLNIFLLLNLFSITFSVNLKDLFYDEQAFECIVVYRLKLKTESQCTKVVYSEPNKKTISKTDPFEEASRCHKLKKDTTVLMKYTAQIAISTQKFINTGEESLVNIQDTSIKLYQKDLSVCKIIQARSNQIKLKHEINFDDDSKFTSKSYVYALHELKEIYSIFLSELLLLEYCKSKVINTKITDVGLKDSILSNAASGDFIEKAKQTKIFEMQMKYNYFRNQYLNIHQSKAKKLNIQITLLPPKAKLTTSKYNYVLNFAKLNIVQNIKEKSSTHII